MKQHQLMSVHCPITRVDDEAREVIGIAFANEVVEGEGGICLSRSAMKAATPGYMRWANVREMHQLSAAGKALEAAWQEDGSCLLRVKVVDDQAWNKVKEGVYQGFSVGVIPRVMDGKTVQSCDWVETSLVDRPKDQGALILELRAEDSFAPDARSIIDAISDSADSAEKPEAEIGQIVEEDADEQALAADQPADLVQQAVEPESVRSSLLEEFEEGRSVRDWAAAQDLLWVALHQIVSDEQMSASAKTEAAAAAVDDFKSIILGIVSRIGASASLLRLSKSGIVEPDEQAVTKRAAPIEGAPESGRVTLNAVAVERVLAGVVDNDAEASIDDQITALERSPGETPQERMATSLQISRLKSRRGY